MSLYDEIMKRIISNQEKPSVALQYMIQEGSIRPTLTLRNIGMVKTLLLGEVIQTRKGHRTLYLMFRVAVIGGESTEMKWQCNTGVRLKGLPQRSGNLY